MHKTLRIFFIHDVAPTSVSLLTSFYTPAGVSNIFMCNEVCIRRYSFDGNFDISAGVASINSVLANSRLVNIFLLYELQRVRIFNKTAHSPNRSYIIS